ncbi:MAG: phosphatidylglycerol lysyltransferase domain-containing protein, partial [Treponema sp.]|nr:phosphatidylglycerol lysyltransferase domain-containing protein [Treponema sp.]
MTPGSAFPGIDTVMRLFESHGYWKNIPLSLLELPCNGIPYRQKLEEQGISFTEDRDNDDYLYLRSDLAGLSGKKFHKKKNLVNAFSYAWPDHEQFPLSPSLIPDAQEILNQWKEDKGDDADYVPSKESLEFFSELEMRGAIYYIGGKPAAYCLGESVSGGSIFCIHFEKGLDRYKGIYQYMNQTFAASLEQEFTFINREQDLGNAGLRQAKLTYRPVSFI